MSIPALIVTAALATILIASLAAGLALIPVDNHFGKQRGQH